VIRHIVLWELKAVDAAAKATASQTIARALESLVPTISEVRSLAVGTDVGIEGNWDIALTADFDSVADLQAYQQHPDHLRVGAIVRELVVRRASVDFDLGRDPGHEPGGFGAGGRPRTP
jgi:hypothetical protein